MFLGRRTKTNRSFQWFGETEFIHQFILRLQKELDKTKYDFRLEFWNTYALPKECWQIAMEFPDGVECETPTELDRCREVLLDRFFKSKELEKVLRIFRWYLKPDRGSVRVIQIAYAVCSECTEGKGPGVLVYWI